MKINSIKNLNTATENYYKGALLWLDRTRLRSCIHKCPNKPKPNCRLFLHILLLFMC